MELKLEKQPRKHLASVDANTRIKFYRALDKLKNLEGNIVRLSGSNDLFRMKIDHYRILFRYTRGQIIVVETINTRTNIKYRRYE